MTDPTPDVEPSKIWLNAFACINPSDEFAAGVGRDIVTMLMRDSTPRRPDTFDPLRRIVIEVVCS